MAVAAALAPLDAGMARVMPPAPEPDPELASRVATGASVRLPTRSLMEVSTGFLLDSSASFASAETMEGREASILIDPATVLIAAAATKSLKEPRELKAREINIRLPDSSLRKGASFGIGNTLAVPLAGFDACGTGGTFGVSGASTTTTLAVEL